MRAPKVAFTNQKTTIQHPDGWAAQFNRSLDSAEVINTDKGSKWKMKYTINFACSRWKNNVSLIYRNIESVACKLLSNLSGIFPVKKGGGQRATCGTELSAFWPC